MCVWKLHLCFSFASLCDILQQLGGFEQWVMLHVLEVWMDTAGGCLCEAHECGGFESCVLCCRISGEMWLVI